MTDRLDHQTASAAAPPGADGILALVDRRLLGELGFARVLAEPPAWVRDLVGLGEVINGLMPLMSDWMARWSAALDYDDSDVPLVHARWTPPQVEANAAAAPPVQARAVVPGAHHSVRVLEHSRQHDVERVIERVPAAADAAPTVSARAVPAEATPGLRHAAGQGSRPAAVEGPPSVQVTPGAPSGPPSMPSVPSAVPSSDGTMPSGPAVMPHAAPLTHFQGPSGEVGSQMPSDMSSPAPSVMPAPSVAPVGMPSGVPSGMLASVPSAAPSGMPSSVPSGMPSIVPSGMPSADGAVPSVSSAAPAIPERGALTPANTGAANTAAAGVEPAAAPIATAPGALQTTARPAAAPAPPGRVHPEGQTMDIAALLAAADGGSRVVSRGVRRGRPPSVTPDGPVVAQATSVEPSAAARPVVSAVAVPRSGSTVAARQAHTRRPATPIVRGATPTPPAPPTARHAPPVVVAAPAADPAPGPAPSHPAAARMVPMGAPRSAEEVARILGGRAPAAPPTPVVAAAPAPAPAPAPVKLAPEQIRTIAGVVQQRVIRHIEQERARTRTRV